MLYSWSSEGLMVEVSGFLGGFCNGTAISNRSLWKVLWLECVVHLLPSLYPSQYNQFYVAKPHDIKLDCLRSCAEDQNSQFQSLTFTSCIILSPSFQFLFCRKSSAAFTCCKGDLWTLTHHYLKEKKNQLYQALLFPKT